MLLLRKLKICSTCAVVGAILMTISYISPGWINISYQYKEDFYHYWNDEKYSNSGHGTYLSNEYTKEGHLSIGVWYFSLCAAHPEYWTDMYPMQFDEKCALASMFYIRDLIYPTEFVDWLLNTALEPYGNSRLEMKIISSVGIAFAIPGLIGTVVYTRRMANSRRVGLFAFVSLSISGATYFSAMVRTLKAIPFYKLDYFARSTFKPSCSYDVGFYCPWGLVLGGIGSLLILISAAGHLYILSRNKTEDDSQEYKINRGVDQGAVSQNSPTPISPPGYHAACGLKVPLIDNVEVKEKTGVQTIHVP